jgi:hypothetical protein
LNDISQYDKKAGMRVYEELAAGATDAGVGSNLSAEKKVPGDKISKKRKSSMQKVKN